MKPATFDYHAPATLNSAIALLLQYKGDARLLAGGQSLLPMMNFRIVTPAAIVDLNRIPDLAYIRVENATVRIGAMTRHRAVEFSPVIAERLPLLAEAIRLVAHLPIRSRGTIGGSLAHADPAAELPMVLQALEGEVVARGPKGERVVKAADLFEGMLTTSLAADEVIGEYASPRCRRGPGMRSRSSREGAAISPSLPWRSSSNATASAAPRRGSRRPAWAPPRSVSPPRRPPRRDGVTVMRSIGRRRQRRSWSRRPPTSKERPRIAGI